MQKIKVLICLLLLISSEVVLSQSLSLSNNGDWVSLGDLDISGNQITVEALVYLSKAEELATNVVSKHTTITDVNYLLRPMTFELTTYISGNSGTTHFLRMYNPYVLTSNKWYHIAGTYDGTLVKFYVDGCLVVSQPFSGNLVQNDLITAIGNMSTCLCEQFYGMIDEVRIWKVCRSQSEIASNMLTLNNPTTQTGLVAYYSLDGNLKNQQGNATWNGVAKGNPTFYLSPINIAPFSLTSVVASNSSCAKSQDATITVTANRPNSSYSIDGTNFQTSSTFSNIKPGNITVHAQSQEGCVLDSAITVGHNNTYIPVQYIKSICSGSSLFGYNTPGVYIDTIAAATGCDSIRTLKLSVKSISTSTNTVSICSSDLPYKWNGLTFSSAGTQTARLTNSVGCDSLATLVLDVRAQTFSTTNVSICQGESYSFNGKLYNTAGTYTAHLVNSVVCDSIATLNLGIKPPSKSTTHATICQGESYNFNGTSYNAQGSYDTHFINAAGCDSVATLALEVHTKTSSTTNAHICQGESYSFNGKTYNTTGTYIVHLVNSGRCDSTATLVLDIKLPSKSTTHATICQGETYTFNAIPYTSQGSFDAHLTNAVGCDSIATLVLTVKPTSKSTTHATMCQGETYNFNGATYTTQGSFDTHLMNKAGCDSTATLILSVLLPSKSTTRAAICDGENYDFNGVSYTTQGSFDAHLMNKAGCDSTATLILTVYPVYYSEQTLSRLSGHTYTINENEYGKEGIYTDILKTINGCDSTVVTTLHITPVPNTFTPNDDGVNDVFMKGWHIQVYNRNGLLLYEGTEGWDGKYQGKPVAKDTYLFILYYQYAKELKSREGYVMVIR